MKSGTCPTPYTRIDMLLRSPCSLNFPNLYDNFVKILVSEIRKCHQLPRDFVPLTPDQGFAPGPHWGLCPQSPITYIFGLPLAEGLDPPLTETSSYTQLEGNAF